MTPGREKAADEHGGGSGQATHLGDRVGRYGPNVDLQAYQQAAARTGGPVSVDHPIVYPTLGLANEAGEVAGKVKKIFRDRDGVVTDADRDAITLELGDVLWYLAELCTQLEIDLGDVAAANLDKLAGRMERGTLGGDGDHR